MNFLRVILLAALFWSRAFAASYYVSATGSDSNAGTSSGSPWQTISKVNAKIADATVISGDSVFFKGGDTFSGSLLVTVPLTVDAYGTGKPIISCGDSYGIRALNTGGVTIRNIKVVGSGVNVTGTFPTQNASTTSTEGGIVHYSTTQAIAYQGFSVIDCEVTGTLQGVMCYNTHVSGTAAGANFVIRGTYIHGCALQGIYVSGRWAPGEDLPGQVYTNVLVSECVIENIPGISGESGGVAVRFFNVANGIIEKTLCTNTAYATTGYPVSILLVNSTFPIVRHCEISYFYTQAGDGDGIDPDLGCYDALIEYNYVHNGPNKTGLFNYAGVRSIFRYNVVENCAGGFRSSGGSSTLYHNTFYNTTNGTATISIDGGSSALYNNIITAKSGATLVSAPSGTPLIGNAYDARSGSTFTVTVNSVTYTSIADLRTAGFEKNGGTDYGASGNPLFLGEGAGLVQLPSIPVAQLAQYNLGTGSPAIGVGIPLSSVSITAPSFDWHGAAVSPSTPDAGAVIYTATSNLGKLIPAPRLMQR